MKPLILLAAVALALAGCGAAPACSDDGWTRAAGHIDINTLLYYDYGEGRQYAGKVVNIQHEHLFDDGEVGRAIQLELSDGTRAWRKRDLIIHDDSYVVRCTP